MIQAIREKLAASVGGEARFASSFSNRTMFSLKERAAVYLDEGAQQCLAMLSRVATELEREKLSDFRQCSDDQLVDCYVRLWAAWQHAGSRTANWMVTGPANFPTQRNQKALAAEDRRYGELNEFVKEAPSRSVKRARGAQKAALGTVGLKSAELDELRERLATRQLKHATWKSINAIIRKHKIKPGACSPADFVSIAESEGLLITEREAAAYLTPNYMGQIGIESFMLSNNNAEMKRLQGRIAQVEKSLAAAQNADDQAVTSRTVGNVEIVENTAEDRLQLLFPGKPSDSVRAMLKRHGFRWSPRNSAWQRQLNNNARYALSQIMPTIEASV